MLWRLQRWFQFCPPRLFFSLKNDLEIHSQRNLLLPQRIERCQQRHDRRFVIRGRARINPPVIVIFGAMLRAVSREGNPLPTGFNGRVAKDWLERFPLPPSCRLDRLALSIPLKNTPA